MEGSVGELPVHRWPDVERRHHSKGAVGSHMLGIVQREPISDPRASIVANDGEAVMAERAHHGHEFVARGPLVPGPGVEHPAVPVSRQVGSDDGEVFRHCRANLMPGRVALGIAMQQQHRRALSSDHAGDVDVRALSWYDRYLGEAPTGAYASEALGRKMTATEKLKGLAAGRLTPQVLSHASEVAWTAKDAIC